MVMSYEIRTFIMERQSARRLVPSASSIVIASYTKVLADLHNA